jgi:hypothetical protein
MYVQGHRSMDKLALLRLSFDTSRSPRHVVRVNLSLKPILPIEYVALPVLSESFKVG